MRWLGLVAALLVAGCSDGIVSAPAGGDAVVYVVERGWHTDITLPVEAMSGPLGVLAAPGVRFVSFGFGERRFLVERRSDFGSMLRALLPSDSALLVTTLKADPAAAFGAQNVVALRVSNAGLEQIEARIWREFETSETGAPVLLGEGPYPGSRFYAARDTYWGLFTCNTWAAATLHAGGLAISSAGVLFSGQVMGSARWNAAHGNE